MVSRVGADDERSADMVQDDCRLRERACQIQLSTDQKYGLVQASYSLNGHLAIAGLGIRSFGIADKKQETFAIWKAGIGELDKCQNVVVKLGGLGMLFGMFDMFDFHTRETPPSSVGNRNSTAAALWASQGHDIGPPGSNSISTLRAG